MSREPLTPLVGWLVFGLAWILLMLVLASCLSGCGARASSDDVDNVKPDGGASAARADCLNDGGTYVTVSGPDDYLHAYCAGGIYVVVGGP